MKKSYTVTEKAGPWVAGQRSPGAGNTLDLTEVEARYALIAEELEETGKARAPRRKPDPAPQE